MLIVLFNMLEIELDMSSHLAECDERWGGRRMEEDVRRKEGGGNMYMLVWGRRKLHKNEIFYVASQGLGWWNCRTGTAGLRACQYGQVYFASAELGCKWTAHLLTLGHNHPYTTTL